MQAGEQAVEAADDVTLLRRYAASADRHAMDELFRRHTAAAYRLAKYISKNTADAEEIVQTVFLDVLRSAQSYRGDAGVKTWIMQMIANKSISRIREESRRKNREQTVIEQRPIFETTPDNAEEHAAVREHLAQLPDHYRLPIYLRYMEGMSTKEVAATLSLTEKTVYSQIERGIEQLQRSMSVAGFATSAMALPAALGAIVLEGPPAGLTQTVANLVAQAPALSTAASSAPHVAKAALTKTGLAIAIPGIAIIAAGGIALLLKFSGTPNPAPVPVTTFAQPAMPLPIRLSTLNVAADGIAVQNRFAYCISAPVGKIVVVDVSDPRSPATLASVPTQFPKPNAIRVQETFLYVTEGGASGRLEIFDISKPSNPVSAGTVALASAEPRGLEVQGDRAYVLQDDGAEIGVYDVSNRKSPALKGTARLAHKTTQLRVQGRYLYTGGQMSNAGYFSVVDISNDSAPAVIGSCNGWQYPNCLLVRDQYAYWPSGNLKLIVVDLSEHAKPALVNATGPGLFSPRAIAAAGRMLWVVDRPAAGNDQLLTYDLTEPAKPNFVQQFDLGYAGTTGLVVDGRNLYAANGGGLTIFDLGNFPDSPVTPGIKK